MHKKLTITQLIDCVQKLSNTTENPDDKNYQIKPMYSTIDDMKFYKLKYKTQKNICDFPPRLKKIFDPFVKNIERVGTFDNNDKNTSLYFSILYCIFNNFETLDSTKQLDCIDKFQIKLSRDLCLYELYEKFNYDSMGWKKQLLINSIREYKNNKMVIRYLADFLFINIFILNIQDDTLYAVYSDENFNVHKLNIFLVYYNELFEPLVYDKNKLWSHQHDPCKKIFNVDKQLVSQFDDNFLENKSSKPLQLGPDNFDKYKTDKYIRFFKYLPKPIPNDIPDYIPNDDVNETDFDKATTDNCYKEIDDSNISEDINEIINAKPLSEPIKLLKDNKQNIVSSDEQNIFCKKVDINDFKNVNKLKLDQLQALAKKYQISILDDVKGKFKNKTKTQLIEALKSIYDNQNN